MPAARAGSTARSSSRRSRAPTLARSAPASERIGREPPVGGWRRACGRGLVLAPREARIAPEAGGGIVGAVGSPEVDRPPRVHLPEVAHGARQERANFLRVPGQVGPSVEYLQGELPVRGEKVRATQGVVVDTSDARPVHID